MEYVKTFEQYLFETTKPKVKFEYADEFCIFDDMIKSFDLSKIPEDELKSQCVNYKVFRNRDIFGTPLSECLKEKRLNEGVNHTVNIKDARHSIMSKYWLNDWQFVIKQGENDIKVAMLIPCVDDNLNFIIEDMESMGYYVRYIEYDEYNGKHYAFIRFDPKFSKDITSDIKQMKHIKHWTPNYNFESIMDNGFLPKSENSMFNYPPRVHFLKEDIDDNNLFELAKDLNNHNKDNKNNGIYTLFTIDTSLIPDNVKFYGDSCYEFGIFTYDKVPFDCVIKSADYKIGK